MLKQRVSCEESFSLPAPMKGVLIVGAIAMALKDEQPFWGKDLTQEVGAYKDGVTFFRLAIGGPELCTHLEVLLDGLDLVAYTNEYTEVMVRHRYFGAHGHSSFTPSPEGCIENLTDFTRKLKRAITVVAAA